MPRLKDYLTDEDLQDLLKFESKLKQREAELPFLPQGQERRAGYAETLKALRGEKLAPLITTGTREEAISRAGEVFPRGSTYRGQIQSKNKLLHLIEGIPEQPTRENLRRASRLASVYGLDRPIKGFRTERIPETTTRTVDTPQGKRAVKVPIYDVKGNPVYRTVEKPVTISEAMDIPRVKPLAGKELTRRQILDEFNFLPDTELDEARSLLFPHEREEFDTTVEQLTRGLRKKDLSVKQMIGLERTRDFQEENYSWYQWDDSKSMGYNANKFMQGEPTEAWEALNEYVSEKKPTKVEALKEATSIISKITSESFPVVVTLPLSEELTEEERLLIEPYIARIELLLPFLPEEQKENIERLFNLTGLKEEIGDIPEAGITPEEAKAELRRRGRI